MGLEHGWVPAARARVRAQMSAFDLVRAQMSAFDLIWCPPPRSHVLSLCSSFLLIFLCVSVCHCSRLAIALLLALAFVPTFSSHSRVHAFLCPLCSLVLVALFLAMACGIVRGRVITCSYISWHHACRTRFWCICRVNVWVFVLGHVMTFYSFDIMHVGQDFGAYCRVNVLGVCILFMFVVLFTFLIPSSLFVTFTFMFLL